MLDLQPASSSHHQAQEYRDQRPSRGRGGAHVFDSCNKAPRPRKEKFDNRNNPASPSPVTDGKNVYVFFPDFGLLAYDNAGKELWRFPLGPFDNMYGMGASPILADEKVILVCDQQTDSFIIAVNKNTGKEVWKTERPEAISGHSTPIIYNPDGQGTQILVPGSFLLTS